MGEGTNCNEKALEPPRVEEAQIVVLGKGVGESVLVHLPGGTWQIIDSFMGHMGPDEQIRPAPLAYLDAIGVCSSKVTDVILTHLHADHCDGIDLIAKECATARLYFPAAVTTERWEETLTTLVDEADGTDRQKLIQVASAFRRRWDSKNGKGRFRVAHAVDVLGSGASQLKAIAPANIATMIARFPELDQMSANKLAKENASSIVVWVEVDGAVALLCGDTDNHPHLGWPALLEEHDGLDWLHGASLVKIPHHGSAGAHHPPMYERWTDEPLGVLTPNAGSRLPRPDALVTLEDATRELWVAGPNTKPKDSTKLNLNSRDSALISWVTCTHIDGDWTVTHHGGSSVTSQQYQ